MLWILSWNRLICCGYSLESPHRGDSDDYPQHMCLWSCEAILMSTHHICFYGKIKKIIPNLSSDTLLICSTGRSAGSPTVKDCSPPLTPRRRVEKHETTKCVQISKGD